MDQRFISFLNKKFIYLQISEKDKTKRQRETLEIRREMSKKRESSEDLIDYELRESKKTLIKNFWNNSKIELSLKKSI